MVLAFEKEDESSSKIQKFFAGSTVLITGATGFLGKLLLEKLLRSCYDIEKIYLLVRPKKGKSEEQRLEELLSNMVFDRMKQEQPDSVQKVSLIPGDCLLPGLGLDEDAKNKLMEEVDCVFHVAATVRFDEKLRTAAYINVRATKDLLVLSRKMKNLKAFVYVSTAYSNCPNEEIKEELYTPPMTPEKLLALVDFVSDEFLTDITPSLIGNWPNTYAYSKNIAESSVKEEGQDLPVAIVRPSIVIGSTKEPMPGWIDNFYGPTGLSCGGGLGVIHTMLCNLEVVADVVPADYVINCIIAAASDIGKQRPAEKQVQDPVVYNYVSAPQKSITWGHFMEYIEKKGISIPTTLMVWYPFAFFTKYRPVYLFWSFLLHWIPAYIADLVALCLGKDRILVKAYTKISKAMDVLSHFSLNQWDFHNENTQSLYRNLNAVDRELFNFDMGSHDWDDYFYHYTRGARQYLLKDPLDTAPQGRRKYVMFKIAHYILTGLLLLGLFKILCCF